MISYFKANDPYRMAGVFLLLLVIRLPFLFTELPLIEPELKWLLIGERLAEDGIVMYRDVWDNTSPLAAFIYKWLHVIFGRTVIPFQIVSLLLVIYQAGIFNNIMLNNKAYNQNTYLPAFVYMIVMNSYFDFMTLSPVLMSMTFILLAMNNLFRRMDNTTRDELFVVKGIYLGLATLFFLPAVLFFFVTIISLLIYTGSIFRRMLLMIYGYLVVLTICSLFFYWYDGGLFFHEFYYSSIFTIPSSDYLSFTEIMMAMTLPIVVLIISIVKMTQEGRYINYQVKIQYVMFFFMIAGIGSLVMVKDFTTYQVIIFMPSLAFFITHYLLTIKNWVIAEGTAALVISAFILNLLMTYNGWIFFEKYMNYSSLKVQSSEYDDLLMNKKVLVVGEALRHYQNAQLSTPFLNWHLSSKWLEEPNYYDNITLIYKKMVDDQPDVILDQKNVMEQVLNAMPTISRGYRKHPTKDNVYLKIN